MIKIFIRNRTTDIDMMIMFIRNRTMNIDMINIFMINIDMMINMFFRNRTPKYREPGVLGGPSQSAPNLAQIPQVDDDQNFLFSSNGNLNRIGDEMITIRCNPSGGIVACTPTIAPTMLVSLN